MKSEYTHYDSDSSGNTREFVIHYTYNGGDRGTHDVAPTPPRVDISRVMLHYKDMKRNITKFLNKKMCRKSWMQLEDMLLEKNLGA